MISAIKCNTGSEWGKEAKYHHPRSWRATGSAGFRFSRVLRDLIALIIVLIKDT